jgi:hypothetical protein
MKLDTGTFCPLLQKDCVKTQCMWFMQVQGTNPNTGEDINEWGCSMAWMPILLIENSKQQRQTGAAVESFRNEMVRANQSSQEILIATAMRGQQTLTIEGKQ